MGGSASSVDPFQGLVKGILCEILAFLPIACYGVDSMEDQFAIFRDKFFYFLASRHDIHSNTLFRFSATIYCDAREGGNVTSKCMKIENWIGGEGICWHADRDPLHQSNFS